MPMKTRRHKHTCLYCGQPASGHKFHIDLHHGKKHIPIHACGHDHLEEMRRLMRDYEVKDGG